MKLPLPSTLKSWLLGTERRAHSTNFSQSELRARPEPDMNIPTEKIHLGKVPEEIAQDLYGRRVKFDATVCVDSVTKSDGTTGGSLVTKIYVFRTVGFPGSLGSVRGESAAHTDLPTNCTYEVEGHFGIDPEDNNKLYLLEAKRSVVRH